MTALDLPAAADEAVLLGLRRRLRQSFPERRLNAAGRVFAYRECGAGEPTIVLLHGIGSTSASWLDVADALAPHARVLAWDAPGYGDSTPLQQARPRAGDYALALESFLKAAGVTRCALVGHSLGGLMAAAHAHGYPQRLERLLLVSPARGYGAIDRRADGMRIRKDRLRALHTQGIVQVAAQAPARLLSAAADATARAWVRWNMAQLDEDGYGQAVELLTGDDIARYAPSPLPVAVWCGEHDLATPPADCRAVAAVFDAPFEPLPNCGHACHIEAPAELAARLLAVIAPVPL
ncbi:alpha/beta fold hydrolase [Chromobacterium haemolyticum]|uniref:alpha/beta fold hydrolase n=1 Tax=Chromobacterium haemolyticum TaxID=394935 RepID=UPI0009D93BAB|nr:alpha/beta hydrolase [Chromobacterium haemolyticum]